MREKINSLLFIVILLSGGILFFVLPKDKISENEKRRLSPFPIYSYTNLISGKYTDSIDSYYSDNFIFRNKLISIANGVKEYTGKKNKEIRLYTKEYSISKQDPIINNEILNDSILDTASTEDIKLESSEGNDESNAYENINSVIVYKKRAIQIFGGSNLAMSKFASMINRYKEEFSPDIKIFCLAIPVGSDFYLPSNFSNNKEKKCIDYLYCVLDILDPSIIRVHAYEELEKHKTEYIQFNTDHHWTGRGAYYAYKAFCKSAGFDSIPMNRLTRKVIPNFLGTLYYHTLNNDLKENKDSVEYFKIPNEIKAYYYSEGIKKEKQTSLYAEYVKGGNSYGVFLGSDFPLMRIISDVKNGRKILQIKDSYGNAFAPFLPTNYEEVFVLDYRYFNGSIKELVSNFGITDIIFTHNIYVINSGYTVKRESLLLNYR